MARRRMLRVFLFVCAFLLQANGLQNAQSSQNSGSIDLTGRWKTADRRQFNVEQNGQHVHATLVPGSDKCANGATLNYLFDGNLSGTSLNGKLTACTDEKLAKDCGLEKVWTTTFNATVGPSKISGKDFITGYMHGDENGHYVNCYADPQYDRYEDFTLVPCEQVVANPYWDDVTEIQPDGSTTLTFEVTCDGVDVKNVWVEIKVDPEKNTGGHVDNAHTGKRLRGQLDGKELTNTNPNVKKKTDASGSVTVKFDPPYKVDRSKGVGIAGTYTVTARSKRFPDSKDKEIIIVKVPDLKPLTESAFSIVNAPQHGRHTDGTYGTSGTLSAFQSTAADFYHAQETHNQQLVTCKNNKTRDPVKASINDIALPNGGLFDVNGNWTAVPGHQTHGKGQGGDFNHFFETGVVGDCDKDCTCTKVHFDDYLLHELLVKGQAHGTWDCSDLGLAPPCMQGGIPSISLSGFQNTPANFPHRLHLHVEDQ